MKKFLAMFATMTVGLIMFCSNTYAEEIILPEVYIKAVNPGYTIDGVGNVGEMIEIGRNSDAPVLLTGLTLSYTNSSGNTSVIMSFPASTWLVGEKILLRLATSTEPANTLYTKTLAAKAGPLEIRRGDEVVDSVCWTGQKDCYPDFKTSNPTTLVRNEETGLFEHVSDYKPEYAAENYLEEQIKDEVLPSQCGSLEFSEILTFYENDKSEQFVEVYNSGSEQVNLKGCAIKYKNKLYELDGVVGAEKYKELQINVAFTKNPASKNVFELIDVNGEVVDTLTVLSGQKRGTSYSLISHGKDGKEVWRVTYAVTPGKPNVFQEYRSCESGKVINVETGNCVKATEVKIAICKDGYYLNLLSGRCNKIKLAEEKVCKSGYEINPETNRCVKTKKNDGADYPLKADKRGEQSSFVGLIAVLIVVGVGIIYVLYEYRKEIMKFIRKLIVKS